MHVSTTSSVRLLGLGLRLGLGAILIWAILGALAFAMPCSVGLGTAALALLAWWGRMGRGARASLALGALIASPILMLQVAAPEYMRASDRIGCEVRAVWGRVPGYCEHVEYDRWRGGDTGAVLSVREQWAVRWLNVSMAAGGTLLGFEDVGYETLLLMHGSSPELRAERQALPLRERQSWCSQAGATAQAEHETHGTIALESARARKLVSALGEGLNDGEAATAPLRWGNYASRDQTWATTLALWVPQSTMTVRRDGDTLQTAWTGTLLYPATSEIAVRLPRPIGESYRFALDEALFCAAQLDGVFVPYRMTWRSDIARDDARLRAPLMNANAPGIVESFVRPLSNELGLSHRRRPF